MIIFYEINPPLIGAVGDDNSYRNHYNYKFHNLEQGIVCRDAGLISIHRIGQNCVCVCVCVRVYVCVKHIVTNRSLRHICLTLILLTWTIWRAPTNASKWRMGFNSAFKGLNHLRQRNTKKTKVRWPSRLLNVICRLASETSERTEI